MSTLYAIDISGVVAQREPMGPGWQCHVEGHPETWARADSLDEAIGGLIRRLAVEYDGANARRVAKTGGA